jgi:hypothetical protein
VEDVGNDRVVNDDTGHDCALLSKWSRAAQRLEREISEASAGTGAFLLPIRRCQDYSVRIMRQTLCILLLFSLACTAVAEKVPADAWQTGTLKDSSESWHSRSAGYVNGNPNTAYGVHGSMASHEYPIVQYIIETATYTYEANLVLHNAREKQPPVTVNGPNQIRLREE